MLLDRAFRLTLRNFGSLFLVVAALTVPLHLAYSVVFSDVITTRELHDEIRAFPEHRQLRSVGRDQLQQAWVGLAIVTVLELAAIPLFLAATERILGSDERGEIPTVGAAFQGLSLRRPHGSRPPSQSAAEIGVALGLAAIVWWLTRRIGLVALEFVSDTRTFPFYGLLQGVAVAVAAPFFLVTWVCARSDAKEGGVTTPKLY